MNSKSHPPAVWSTASFGDAPETKPGELAALGDHLNLCQRAQSRMFAVHCMMESTGSFLLSRVFTSLVIAAILALILSLAS